MNTLFSPHILTYSRAHDTHTPSQPPESFLFFHTISFPIQLTALHSSAPILSAPITHRSHSPFLPWNPANPFSLQTILTSIPTRSRTSLIPVPSIAYTSLVQKSRPRAPPPFCLSDRARRGRDAKHTFLSSLVCTGWC
jgi:hypothetical protein